MNRAQLKSIAQESVRLEKESDVRTRRMVSIIAAPVAVAVVWLVASPIFGIDLAAEVGGEVRPIGLVSIVATALLAGLAGTALVVGLETATARPRRSWLAISVTFLVVSMGGPLLATSGSAGVVLMIMHLTSGTILIPGLMPRAGRASMIPA